MNGRFTAEDVIKGNGAVPETLNQYGYCLGNPEKFVDFDGRVYIVAWSYSQENVYDFEKYMNKNNKSGLVIDGDISDWTDDVFDEWDQRCSFYRAAQTKYQSLIDSGVAEDNIKLVRIDGEESLEEYWDEWKDYPEIEGMDFFTHGYSGGAEVYSGSKSFWEYAEKLNFTEDAEVVFYGCNTATGSFAQDFANKQVVTTYAQPAYTSFSSNPDVMVRINDFDTSLGIYLYTYKHGFKKIPKELNILGTIITYDGYEFDEWNFYGKGVKFEPCIEQ